MVIVLSLLLTHLHESEVQLHFFVHNAAVGAAATANAAAAIATTNAIVTTAHATSGNPQGLRDAHRLQLCLIHPTYQVVMEEAVPQAHSFGSPEGARSDQSGRLVNDIDQPVLTFRLPATAASRTGRAGPDNVQQ